MKEKFYHIGNITCEKFNQNTLDLESKLFNRKLRENLKCGIINREEFLKNFIFGKKTFKENIKNVISLQGFNCLSRFLVNDNTYAGGINMALYGDGTGTPSENDTQLFNEIYRNEQASRSSDENQILLTAFLDVGEYSGVIKEFGNCINGDVYGAGSGINTGRLWSHIGNLNWTKDENSTITISQLYTISNK